MGQGTKTIFPQLVAAELGIGEEDVDLAPVDTSLVPDSGPTVASRTAMVVGGLAISAARRLREQVENATGRPFSASAADYAREHGPVHIEQRFEPYPGIHFDDATYTGDAYPCFGWAAAVAEVDVDLDTGEVAVRSVVAVDDVGRVIHPVLAEGQVEGGTLQAVGYATIEEMQPRRRPLPQRPTGHLPHPHRARRAAHRDHPRGVALQRGAPRRQGGRGAAHGCGRARGGRRHPRRDRRLDPRPAGDPGAHPGRHAGGPMTIRFRVNGDPVELDVPGMRRLLDALREDLGLTGTKEGCGEGECGACSVLLDGQVVDCCLVPMCQVEGTATCAPWRDWPTPMSGTLSPLQQAFLELGGAQCGICTPGMLMAAQAYLDAGGGRQDGPSGRRSRATSVGAPATPRSWSRSPTCARP